MFCLKLPFLFFCSCFFLKAIDAAADQQLLVQFDLVQAKDWSKEVLLDFKQNMAEYVQTLCNVNMSFCGITSTSTFTVDNVVIEAGYPKVQDVNSLVLFAVTLPKSGFDVNTNVYVKKEAIKLIVNENRKEIQASLIKTANEPYEASFRISFVDNELVLEMGDQTLNNIIIPIACSIVLLMTMTILALEARKRMKLKAQLKKIEANSKKEGRLLTD